MLIRLRAKSKYTAHAQWYTRLPSRAHASGSALQYSWPTIHEYLNEEAPCTCIIVQSVVHSTGARRGLGNHHDQKQVLLKSTFNRAT